MTNHPILPSDTNADSASGDFHRRSIYLHLACVCVASVVTAASGAPGWLIVVVTGIAAMVTAVSLAITQSQRNDQCNRSLQRRQSEAENWRQRWSELKGQSQQSTIALSQMMDGVVMLSNNGQILLINVSALRLLGLSDEADHLGRSFIEVVRIPETTQAIRASRNGQGEQVVNIEVSDDHQVRPVRVHVNRIGEQDNGNILLTLRDETESRRVEMMRRDFVANVSHEIKTPIAAIKGYVETAELAIEDDTQAAKHFVSQIHGQCLRLERLVSDMLQIARAQSGQLNLRKTQVSLGDIVSESLRSIKPIAESKSIELIVADLSAAIIFADHEATLTIVNNLISNAIHYSPSDTEVLVSTKREDDFWVLSVQDRGVGIAQHEQKRIFERFYRVDRNRTSASGGTGIGLSIVKNLAVAQNGKVRLRSSIGNGSTFEVLLPAAPQQPLVSQSQAVSS